jgi:amidase
LEGGIAISDARDHENGSVVVKYQTRRDVLLASGAIATTVAISAATRGAIAQNAGSIAPSQWNYRSIKELTDALQARKISSLELVDHTVARIEALDKRLNAVVVRDFERAREAAKAADVALARGERRPLLGIPVTIKEFLNSSTSPVCRPPGESRSSRNLCRRTTLSLFRG